MLRITLRNVPRKSRRKKRSLLDAAVEVLRLAKMPMNTREIVDAAIELKLWQPTGAKTPEQTLYGAIVRENKTKAPPKKNRQKRHQG